MFTRNGNFICKVFLNCIKDYLLLYYLFPPYDKMALDVGGLKDHLVPNPLPMGTFQQTVLLRAPSMVVLNTSGEGALYECIQTA